MKAVSRTRQHISLFVVQTVDVWLIPFAGTSKVKLSSQAGCGRITNVRNLYIQNQRSVTAPCRCLAK